MNIQTHPRDARNGNVLLTSLIIGSIIGVALAGYLDMVAAQNKSIARSQAWNSAIPIAEAGIEEALTQIYYTGATNLTSNGWRLDLAGVYTKSRSGVLGGRYLVAISNDTPPTIYSTGFLPKPLLGGEVSRRIRITTRGGFLFAKGLVAKGNISLGNGNVDSFDSGGVNNFSRGGTVLKSNGDTTSLTGNISLSSNGAINGHASVGAGESITGGTIGPIGTASGTYSAGYTGYNATGNIQDVTLPQGLTSSASLDLSRNYLFLFSGSYQCSGISGAIVIPDGVHVTLYCDGSFSGPKASVTIAPTGSLTVYMTGPSVSLDGNMVVNPGACQNFILFGLPTLTSVTVSGNGNFSGCIDAPEASVVLNGSGSGGFLAGAVIAKDATFNGNGTSFNYDESLGRIGPNAAYSVGSWTEL